MRTTEEARRAVVAEAKSWLRTPYHHRARVKGVGGGVDCGTLLLEVYARAGIIPSLDTPLYPPDFALHRDEEWYVAMVSSFATEVAHPGIGDAVLYRVGRVYSHGGIVVHWPLIVHATFEDRGVCLAEGDRGRFAERPRKYFSPWGGP